ncbi:MAG TPA: helix-turn-helix domain-containing protein [Nitrososphaerales archaeon]|nr:helix-turn-helix domain-containing protein [Nitrososphaerales archaeon]
MYRDREETTIRQSEEGDQQILSTLLEFGLTPLQRKIFVSLVGMSGLTTTEISRVTKVHRSDVYRALRKLLEIGLVEVDVESPSRYYAIEPIKAVRLLLEGKREELISLESKTDALTEWLERQRESALLRNQQQSSAAKKGQDDDDTATFRLVKGNAVTPKVISSIQSARREIVKVVSALALRRHYIEFAEYEEQATARGVTVKILTEIQPQNYRIAKSYAGCAHLRHVANLDRSLRYLVIDGSELVLAGTVQYGDEPDRSVLTTKNSVLVRGCVSYFEDMWAKSLSFEERLRVVTKSLGGGGKEQQTSTRSRTE